MYENLMEEAVSPENYGKALRAVIANDGAPGIDWMRTEELNGHLLQHWPKIHAKPMAGPGPRGAHPGREEKTRKKGGGTAAVFRLPAGGGWLNREVVVGGKTSN